MRKHESTAVGCVMCWWDGWVGFHSVAQQGTTADLKELLRKCLRTEVDSLGGKPCSDNQVASAEALTALLLEAATAMEDKLLSTLQVDCAELTRVSKVRLQTAKLSKAVSAYRAGGKLEDLLRTWNMSETVDNSAELIEFLVWLLSSLETLAKQKKRRPLTCCSCARRSTRPYLCDCS
eukprot:5012224-Amphidinium_carterae.1